MKPIDSTQTPATTEGRAVELAPHGAYRFDVACGDRVRVVAGAIWLTAAGMASDCLLTAGDSLCMARSGSTWVEPCALSTLVVERFGSTYLQ